MSPSKVNKKGSYRLCVAFLKALRDRGEAPLLFFGYVAYMYSISVVFRCSLRCMQRKALGIPSIPESLLEMLSYYEDFPRPKTFLRELTETSSRMFEC